MEMNNGENHWKRPSEEGEGLTPAKASAEQGVMVALIEHFLGRIRLAALALVAGVALSGWNCDDLRYRPVAQETPAVESDAGEAAGSADGKAPDLGEGFKGWVFEEFGFAGLFALAVGIFIVSAAGGILWKWPEIRKRPFVGKIIDRCRRLVPLPKADLARFTVALAHLENDSAQEKEKLIFQGLNEGFAGTSENAVQILRFNRTIETVDAQDLEAVVATGHQTAPCLSGKIRCRSSDLGICAEWRRNRHTEVVLDHGCGGRSAKGTGSIRNAGPSATKGFLEGLGRRFAASRGHAGRRISLAQGAFRGRPARPVRRKVQSLLTGGGQGWTGDASARVKLVLADSLSTLGEQSGANPPLEEAVVRYREVLTHYTREKVPLNWAATQNNLGAALASLGERESGTERLEEAVGAYREALKEYTREKVPLDWAMTQNNLGATLARLGERESGTERLEEAVGAYREALKEYTREKVPLDWAATQNNLGAALRRLGERESGTKRLEEAVGAYREALQEYTREKVPLDWAMTQNNIGTALQSLGERESGTARLEQAVEAYRAALEEYTREKVPLDWAMTQNNLGTALGRLGERESGTERLEQAVGAFREALQEWTREKVPLDWAMTQNNLGLALLSLGERESGTERLEEAVAAYRAALQELIRGKVPLDWAMTQNNLGSALRSLGERSRDAELVCDALGAHLAGWEVFSDGGASHYAAIAKNGITSDMAVLRDVAQPAEYEQCIDRHRPALDAALGGND